MSKGIPSPVRALFAALTATAMAPGCSDPAPTRDADASSQIIYRFVDASLRAGAVVEPPGLVLPSPGTQSRAAGMIDATIRDDTRYVLSAHPEHVLGYLVKIDPVAKGRISFSEPLQGRFPEARSLLYAGFTRLPGKLTWEATPAVRGVVEPVDGRRTAQMEFDVPGARPGAIAEVTIRAHRPPLEPTTRYTTPPVAIPARAHLEVAFGVLEAASEQGPVRFSIAVCRDGDCDPIFEEVLSPGMERATGWQDRRIPLENRAGQHLSLRFEAEPTEDGAETLALWANPTIVADKTGPGSGSSIILLSIDTLRRDHLDLYGYSRRTAPFLRDVFATRGAVFSNLISEAATTDPSHMTLFTSLPALTHGVGCCGQRLAVPVVTLAESFRRAGYATAAFTENGPLAHERGFSIGFDSWRENKSTKRLSPPGQVKRTFEQARRWLERNDDRPFFLFVHTFQVHGPYEPPAQYSAHFPLDPGSSKRDRDVANYDREIRYTDDELRKFFEWAEAREGTRDTVWFVLSDHGEEFYEHGSLGHGTLPYEQVLQVPLIAVGAGIPGGIRSDTALTHADIMPTILELAGVEGPEHMLGRSFAAELRGEPTGDDAPRPRFSASWILPDGMETPAFSVRVGSRKLIEYRDADGVQRRMYDLAVDPGEHHDLSETNATDAAELAALLSGYRSEAKRTAVSLRIGASLPPEAPSVPVELDPEREEELRALGYID